MPREKDVWGNFWRWEKPWSPDDARLEAFWQEKLISVEELRFSQDTVRFNFSDGSGSLLDMILHLMETGAFSGSPLAVLVHEGVYYSCNNRRLAALKIYEYLSRLVVRKLQRDVSSRARDGISTKVGESFFVYPLAVPCAVRDFRSYDCSHDVECHRSPKRTNFLFPRECQDVRIRWLEITALDLARAVGELFLSAQLDPELQKRLVRNGYGGSLLDLRQRLEAVNSWIAQDREHRRRLEARAKRQLEEREKEREERRATLERQKRRRLAEV